MFFFLFIFYFVVFCPLENNKCDDDSRIQMLTIRCDNVILCVKTLASYLTEQTYTDR